MEARQAVRDQLPDRLRTRYFVGSRLGPKAEARFLRGLEQIEVESPAPDDWERIADLVDEYADLPLGGTDASVVTLAERLHAGT